MELSVQSFQKQKEFEIETIEEKRKGLSLPMSVGTLTDVVLKSEKNVLTTHMRS